MANIVLYPSELLAKKSEVVEKFDDELAKLFTEMEQAMRNSGGIGISAIQIGVPLRAMIVMSHTDGSLIKVVNPEVVDDPSAPTTFIKEGCLSIPGISVAVHRPEDAEVNFRDDKGEGRHLALDGMTARCFLHELDHLNGMTILDRVSSITRSSALKKYNKR